MSSQPTPRPPPLPWHRPEWWNAWRADACRALGKLGPPDTGAGPVALDAAPFVLITVEGCGRRETWVSFEPFRLRRQLRRGPRPGAPFVVLTVRGGGLVRSAVLFEPFRIVPAPWPTAARHRARRAPLTCTSPPLRRAERHQGQPRCWSRSTARPVEVRATAAPSVLPTPYASALAGPAGAQLAAVPEMPPAAAPVERPPTAPELAPGTAPAQPEWPWPPCPLAPVEAHPPELVRAAIKEHRLHDLTEGNPGPHPPPPRPRLPKEGATHWPDRKDGGRTFSDCWFELAAIQRGEQAAMREATSAAREVGFLVHRALGPAGALWVATLEDEGLRRALGGAPVVVKASTVEELRAALRPYWRVLVRLGRPATLPRRKHPKKTPAPEQFALDLALPASPKRQQKKGGGR